MRREPSICCKPRIQRFKTRLAERVRRSWNADLPVGKPSPPTGGSAINAATLTAFVIGNTIK